MELKNFELDVWVENDEKLSEEDYCIANFGNSNMKSYEEYLGETHNLDAFWDLLESYEYVVHGYDIIKKRESDARFAFFISYVGDDDLDVLEWLGDFYQVKNQFGEVI